MTTQSESISQQLQLAALRARLAEVAGSDLISDPALGEALAGEVAKLLGILDRAAGEDVRPPDGGLAQLAGIGDESAQKLGDTRLVPGVENYDENVRSERILALADLYYIYQHE